MARGQWCIGLSPSGLSVSRGGAPARWFAIEPGAFADAASKSFRPLTPLIERSARECGIAAGASVVVAYHAPDAVVDVFSYPFDDARALRAAGLALRDKFPGGTEGQPEFAAVAGRDAASTGARTHVIAGVDKDQNVRAIADTVLHAGLKLARAVPAGALGIEYCLRRALAGRGEGASCVLYLGASATCLAAVRDGTLSFARVMNFGTDALVDVYQREMASAGRNADRASAVDLAWRVGVTTRQTARRPDALAADTLPLLMPTIQKYLVEIKQTLRFGLGESEFGRLRVRAAGPGATFAGFVDALADGLDLPIESAPDDRCAADIAALGGASAPTLGLVPEVLVRQKTERRLVGAAVVGVTLAAGLIAGDVAWHGARLADQERQLRASAEEAALGREHFTAMRQADQLAAELRRREDAVRDAVGQLADWPGVLMDIARGMDQRLRLTEFTGEASGKEPSAQIRGVAFREAGGDALKPFMDRLSKSPLVAAVSLGATQSGEADGRPAVHFTLTVTFRGVPARFEGESERRASAGGAE